ncbi:MAG: acetyl-CoA C-acyltransferase [Veillonella caviae]|uniref:acetyl-CoA C-acyltransferase n=1 Tax=Veillonella caviae TaxID=248316 RepID=UPI002A91420A|nr:acetyl-CoA C-acyltransferase [Veillonella caviae]MDY5481376.1 acetyl-CoA C-acyltransferase [Veillonella caviae]
MSVYIHHGLRTPIGVVNGQYKYMRPELLGAKVIDQLLCTTDGDIHGLFCGNAVGTGGNIARLMGLYSSLSPSVPAVTVDMQCASALMSIEIGYAHIASGLMDTVIAGGIESSSLQPMRVYANGDERNGSYKVAQFSPYEHTPNAMLEGAERTMRKYNVTHEELAPYIISSHQRAAQARKEGILDSIVMPIVIDGKDCVDESIRPNMNERLLKRMKPLLGIGSLVTAGNACLTHDGAGFVVLSKEQGPFRIHSMHSWAGNPLYSPEGALYSTEQILKCANLSASDIDVFEWNEAFAVISALFGRQYSKLVDRYNIFGGALAYGHPYGCSGSLLVLHCMRALEERNGRYGLCAIAGAGGTGTAMIIERL